MTHNIYYCIVHKVAMHSMHMVGPHARKHGGSYDMEKQGLLLDLGECWASKFANGGCRVDHMLKLEELSDYLIREIDQRLSVMKQ